LILSIFRLVIWLFPLLGELQWRDRSGMSALRQLHRIPHLFPARATSFPKIATEKPSRDTDYRLWEPKSTPFLKK
jgi:hypothetical protein